MTAARRRIWDDDTRFGICPSTDTKTGRCCNDGYINVGGVIWFICEEHKTCWRADADYRCDAE